MLATVVALVIAAWPTAELAADASAARMCVKALAAIKADALAGDRFTFCVIGDTQPPGRAVFLESIKEMNLLAPAFIIGVGDMISYPGGSAEAIHSRWDEFLSLCAALRVPLFPVVGNHDVGDWRSRGIYRERMAPLGYSLSYGDAHSICLDTEEPGYSDRNHERISPAQLRWLKEDVEAHKDAIHVLVFMHKPIWNRGTSDRIIGFLPLRGVRIAPAFMNSCCLLASFVRRDASGIFDLSAREGFLIVHHVGGQFREDPESFVAR